jgi:hypothetical protein
MLTDYDLEEMAKTFRAEKKFNVMAGMGLKLLGEIELLRMQNRHAKIDGIKMAAEIASNYDFLSMHDYLVSDCILGKLNVVKRKPRKNPTAYKLDKAIELVERKVSGLDGTMRFLALSSRRKQARKK